VIAGDFLVQSLEPEFICFWAGLETVKTVRCAVPLLPDEKKKRTTSWRIEAWYTSAHN
jgi:hypothetical protein